MRRQKSLRTNEKSNVAFRSAKGRFPGVPSRSKIRHYAKVNVPSFLTKHAAWLAQGLLVVGICHANAVQAQVPPPGVFVEPGMSRPAPYLPPGRPGIPLKPDPRLMPGPPGVFVETPRFYSVRDYSWHYIVSPQPREIKQQDLVTILVKEMSEASVNSQFNRQRRSTLLAELREFIRIGPTGNLDNAAENEPTIDANLNGRLNSTGQVKDKTEVVYRIAATVVDVLPNGNLVLEAQKQIQTGDDIWKHTLTGIIRSQDINRDNTALSENIANLKITKVQCGKVYDSTKRPWGTRLYDLFFPF